MTCKLGSLFDGSGGFPLAGSLCGISPVWASEVEPYPIAVTRSRFPAMKHLGSVTDVHGGDIDPVDIITFGSPCQDLSVAGKRAGLKHTDNGDESTTRSGLFMEAVRIIKEMREATNGEYPTFAVWENVPGAFSSNKGEDFRTVLEELIKIVEPTAVMPAVPKNGWPYADSYCGDGWSLAYRVFDAQYWGVPQRRRRIYLVLDLRGQRAGKVSFEREGLRGNFAESGTPWKAVAGDAADCAGADDCKGIGINGEVAATMDASYYKGCGMRQGIEREVVVQPIAYTLKIRSGCEGGGKGALIQEDKSATLATNNDQYLFQPVAYSDGQTVSTLTGDHENRITDYTTVICLQGNGIDRADTAGCNGKGWKEDICYTLNTIDRPAVAFTMQAFGNYKDCGVCSGLKARDYKDATDLVVQGEPIIIDRAFFNQGENAKYDPQYCTDGVSPTLVARGPHACLYQYIVRRLTPTECARLQGFPDNWGHPDHKEDFADEEYRFWLNVRNTHAAINGKPQKDYTKAQMLTWYNRLHTDSSEYKMYGNGIALPCALYVMQGIKEALIHDGMEIDNRIRK